MGSPLPGTRTVEEATADLTQIVGGIAKNRLLEAGDVIPVFMILLDAEGRIMSPEPDMIQVEADGAFVTEEPGMIPGSYDVYAFLETEPGLGPGEVRVKTADGRLLASFPFERRARGQVAVSGEESFVTLTPLEDPDNPDTLFEVRVAPMNAFGEHLGVSCVASMEIEGGVEEESLELETSGHQIARVRSDGTDPLLTVRVTASGVELGEVSVDVPYSPPVVEGISSPCFSGRPRQRMRQLQSERPVVGMLGSGRLTRVGNETNPPCRFSLMWSIWGTVFNSPEAFFLMLPQ